LQADAYVAYDSFFTNPARGLVEVACWAHTRRHFHQALDNDSARMGAVLAYIAQLYAVEKTARQAGLMGDDLRLLRQQGAVPVLMDLHAYLLRIRDEVLPKSAAGQAVNYALKNWPALTRYSEDGGLAIDNNHTERSLRGIAVGRNYVYSRIMCSRPDSGWRARLAKRGLARLAHATWTKLIGTGRLSIIKASAGTLERGPLADTGTA
jgi:hypothetical protein